MWISENSPSETVWKISGISQPHHHDSTHRRVDKRLAGSAQPLIVLAHASVLAQPPEGALHYPASGQNLQTPSRKQPLPVDLSPLLCPLLCPNPCDLLRYRLW